MGENNALLAHLMSLNSSEVNPELLPPGIFLGSQRTRPPWSPDEDLILLMHVAKNGTKNWSSLQASGQLPLRDQKACCNRFILLKRRCMKEGSDVDLFGNLQTQSRGCFGPAKKIQKANELNRLKGSVPPEALDVLIRDAKARALLAASDPLMQVTATHYQPPQSRPSEYGWCYNQPYGVGSNSPTYQCSEDLSYLLPPAANRYPYHSQVQQKQHRDLEEQHKQFISLDRAGSSITEDGMSYPISASRALSSPPSYYSSTASGQDAANAVTGPYITGSAKQTSGERSMGGSDSIGHLDETVKCDMECYSCKVEEDQKYLSKYQQYDASARISTKQQAFPAIVIDGEYDGVTSFPSALCKKEMDVKPFGEIATFARAVDGLPSILFDDDLFGDIDDFVPPLP